MNIKKPSKELILLELKDYVTITLGMLMFAVGWRVFLLPNEITAGGVPGIASILNYATGIDPTYPYFVLNLGLLILAVKVMGWKFSIKTIFAVFTLTTFTFFVGRAAEGTTLLQSQPFMACIIGSTFCGVGVGLALSSNGSTGGTDIIAAIVNKYKDMSLGTVILLCDLVIITSSYLILKDWEKVIYGYVYLFICSFMVDHVVNSRRQSVQFFIISEKYEEIGQKLNELPRRGVTIINSQGFYSRKEMNMLFLLAKRRESSTIFRLIKEVDPDAFVSQSAVIGVYGKGFDVIKAKTKVKKIEKDKEVIR